MKVRNPSSPPLNLRGGNWFVIPVMGMDISAMLCMSPCRSDYIISHSVGVERVVVEGPICPDFWTLDILPIV